jgi:hypothetical protein
MIYMAKNKKLSINMEFFENVYFDHSDLSVTFFFNGGLSNLFICETVEEFGLEIFNWEIFVSNYNSKKG